MQLALYCVCYLIKSFACTSFPESNADYLELPDAEAANSDTTVTTKLETNIDGDPKNYVAVQPVYEWKEITGEFFDAVKGKVALNLEIIGLLSSRFFFLRTLPWRISTSQNIRSVRSDVCY